MNDYFEESDLINGMYCFTSNEGGLMALLGAVFMEASYQTCMRDLKKREHPVSRFNFMQGTASAALKMVEKAMKEAERGAMN